MKTVVHVHFDRHSAFLRLATTLFDSFEIDYVTALGYHCTRTLLVTNTRSTNSSSVHEVRGLMAANFLDLSRDCPKPGHVDVTHVRRRRACLSHVYICIAHAYVITCSPALHAREVRELEGGEVLFAGILS